MSETPLSAVVPEGETETAIAALRAEGVYDDGRSVRPYGNEAVAIPVTRPPDTTAVREVVQEAGQPRLRTLEDHLRERGWSEADLEQAPSSWAVLGTVILVEVGDAPKPEDAAGPDGSSDPPVAPAPEDIGDALLALHGEADTVLARGGVAGEHREPAVSVLAGEGDTETVHVEHGTTYAMDLAEVMFAPGNKAERARMGEVTGPAERVLDMFAGIGYFALPMARAGAEVTAVERNPTAFQYLLENAMRNDVTDRLHAYRGDNREVVPELVREARFDRVVMGYYEAHEYLDSALAALAPGGVVHMHEATPSGLVYDRPIERLRAAADEHGRAVEVLDTRRVKGYSEGVDHVVVDARVD